MTEAYVKDFEVFAANGGSGGPAWLPARRRQAIEQFAAAGFPTSRNEDWKFTSVAPIAQRAFHRPGRSAAGPDGERLAEFVFGEAGWCELVFVNGRLVPAASRTATLPRGVRVASLAEALETDPGLLERHLGRQASHEARAFTALNTAFLLDGALVEVAAGAVVPVPIHLVFLSDGRDGTVVSYPRNLILTGAGAQVTVIESYGSTHDGVYFTNAVTEIAVGENAGVEHIKIQRESEQAYHVGTVEARLGRHARFRSFSFAVGGALSRTNIYSVMEAEGADCVLNGLYMVNGHQHVDHQTRIEHAAPNCTSREVYKGILDGQSHGVFNGKVYVRPEAQKTDGKQTNKNLLLSEGARVDTKPQLEIFADDVKCTHGATVGRLDDLALFYLRSRGVTPALARKILTYGFATDVLSEMGHQAVRARLERHVFQRLKGGEAV